MGVVADKEGEVTAVSNTIDGNTRGWFQEK